MIIIRLLNNIITAKKILQNSGRITLAFLLENRANTHNNLIYLCVLMGVSASFCQTTSRTLDRNTLQVQNSSKQSP